MAIFGSDDRSQSFETIEPAEGSLVPVTVVTAIMIASLLPTAMFGSPLPTASAKASDDAPTVPFLVFASNEAVANHPLLDGGNGSEENPYVFEDIRIEPHFRGIYLENTDAHVVFRNITIQAHPITDSQAEDLLEDPTNVHYPHQDIFLPRGLDPRVIQGVHASNAQNVVVEDVEMHEVHHGVYATAGAEVTLRDGAVVTDVWDEQLADTFRMAGAIYAWSADTSGEAGILAFENSTVRTRGLDLTLTGTGVAHPTSTGENVTYQTLVAKAVDSTLDLEGLTSSKATFGVLASTEASRFTIEDSTITGNVAYDLHAEEAQGTVRNTTLGGIVDATAYTRNAPDGAPTADVRFDNVTLAGSPVIVIGPLLAGERFSIRGLTVEDPGACAMLGDFRIQQSYIEDCDITRTSWVFSGGLAEGPELSIEDSHLVDISFRLGEPLPDLEGGWANEPALLEDTLIEGSTRLETAFADFEGVRFQDDPDGLHLDDGMILGFHDVAFDATPLQLDVQSSPGSLKLEASNITANGLPVHVGGGTVSGGLWGGVIAPSDSQPLTVEDGAVVRGLGIVTLGHEDLRIRNSTIAGEHRPIQVFGGRDIEIVDAGILGGGDGICLQEVRETRLQDVRFADTGLHPGPCLGEGLKAKNVTVNGAPLVQNPTQPVNGTVGQLIASDQDVVVRDATFTGQPTAISVRNGDVLVENATAPHGLLWAQDGSQAVVRNATGGPADGWVAIDRFASLPIGLSIAGYPDVHVEDTEAASRMQIDRFPKEPTLDTEGDVRLSNVSSGSGIYVGHYESLEAHRVRTDGSILSSLPVDRVNISDSFLEDSRLTTYYASEVGIENTTVEEKIFTKLQEPPARRLDPKLSQRFNASWEMVNQSLPEAEAEPPIVGDLRSTLFGASVAGLGPDPRDTFWEVEKQLYQCDAVTLIFECGFYYRYLLRQTLESQQIPETNAEIHGSNLLGEMDINGDGTFNATNNWWGQASGPRDDQIPDWADVDAEPWSREPFNEPPSVNVSFQGQPVAGSTLIVHVQAIDERSDVESLEVQVGSQRLHGSGTVQLPDDPGTITWTARAADGFGADDVDEGTIEVLPRPSGTIHTAPDQPRAGDPLYANLEGTTDAYRVEWDWRDDGSLDATGANATFLPDAAGTYALRAHFVHEGDVLGDTLTHVSVSEPGQTPPEASVSVSASRGQAPLTVKVDGLGYDRDGFVEHWELRLDGETQASGVPPFPGETLTLDHGNHDVSLVYTDDDDLTGVASASVSVTTAPVTITEVNVTVDGSTPPTYVVGERPLLAVSTADEDADSAQAHLCLTGSGTDVCESRNLENGNGTWRLPPLPEGASTVDVEVWDGQGSRNATRIALTAERNDPPTLDPSVPSMVQAGQHAHLTATTQDPEDRGARVTWTTPSGVHSGPQATFTPGGWGNEIVQVTSRDPHGGSTTEVRWLAVDAELTVDASVQEIGASTIAVPVQTDWFPSLIAPATVEAVLSWNGYVIDTDQTHTGTDGIGLLHLEDSTQGHLPGPYTVEVHASTFSPPADAEPGLEEAHWAREVAR